MVVTTRDGQQDIAIGDPVYAADGIRIGYVLAGDASQLYIGDGVLFRRTFPVDLAIWRWLMRTAWCFG